MNNKAIIITRIVGSVLLAFMGYNSIAQQSPMYSQYMFNMLNINPAYAGQREVGNFTVLWRNQWVGFPGAPTTGSISYDQKLNDKNGSIGAQFYYDKIGVERTTGFQGFYSYTAPFNNSALSLGMSLGVLNYFADFTKTNPFEPGDPNLQQTLKGGMPTAGFGALWSSKKWFVGFSAPALFKTKLYTQDQSRFTGAGRDAHYFLNGGYVFSVNSDVVIKPSFLLKAVEGTPVQADLNCNVWLSDIFGFGVSYRSSDAVLGMLELQAKPQLRIGYAYDYNTSKLVNYNRGTHELMLRYDLKKKDREEIDQNTPFSYLYGKPVAAPPPPPPAAPAAKDSDGDGVSDEFDSCPDAAGLKELSGCPDKDGDRVADKYDECPDVAGSQFMNGCPDKDGDGVADFKDACPDKKGSLDFNGCPDSDGDGISDDKDQCPQIKGYSYNQGCPPSDKDNDGIPDDRDKCPEIAGKSANKGCPGWDDLNFNPKNVTFVTGSSQLTALAVKELDILTEIMRRNPAMSVDIIGHTDNVGSPAF
ncbi:MAG: hypothetical protein RL732_1585, partial [Bacteroidota bacterium]